MARRGKPVVSIIGRPNVGKSSLFNRIINKKLAIVDEKEGVTRDRHYFDVTWQGIPFLITDTGGLVPDSDDIFQTLIEEQVEIAIQESEVIIFLVDAKTGVVDLDELIARKLKKEYNNKNIILAVNKVDNSQEELLVPEFYKLGFDNLIPISSLHGKGIGDLLDLVVEHLKSFKVPKEEDEIINLAIIGKPNVGKSSLFNSIVGSNEVIVSDIPGTTRDPIDTVITVNKKKYRFIDTAGLKKRKRINDDIDFYSILRTYRQIELADVLLLVLDATRPFSNQDEEVVNILQKYHKPLVVLFNKWDAIENKDTMTFVEYTEIFKYKFRNISYAPTLAISAKTKQRIMKIFDLVELVYQNYFREIDRDELFEYFLSLIRKHYHKPVNNKPVRFSAFYQSGVAPPTFVVHTNQPLSISQEYKRYLVNRLREKYDFTGVPIKLITRKSKDNNIDLEEIVL